MIRITGYGVIAEKPRVGKLGQFFPCTLWEKLCVGSKNEWHLLWWARRALSPCKVWGRSHIYSAGCRCENVVFVFWGVCHAPSPVHRAFEGCIVRTSFVLPFIARFRRGFQRFFQKGLLFQMHYKVRISVARWRHNVREIAVKNCENPKIRRKSLCAPLRTDSWGFWKKFYHSCLGPRL